MTNAEWEAANEDDSDRWACYEAQTGLYAPNSDRVVWRDRGERIAALEARLARVQELAHLWGLTEFPHEGTANLMRLDLHVALNEGNQS